MQMEVLFGFQEDDLEAIRGVVEQALEITFERHTNAYRGEHYVGVAASAVTLILQRNWDPFDGELMEEHFPNMRILLYVTASDRMSELERRLTTQTAACMLLRPES
jgi:hypothetical protein